MAFAAAGGATGVRVMHVEKWVGLIVADGNAWSAPRPNNLVAAPTWYGYTITDTKLISGGRRLLWDPIMRTLAGTNPGVEIPESAPSNADLMTSEEVTVGKNFIKIPRGRYLISAHCEINSDDNVGVALYMMRVRSITGSSAQDDAVIGSGLGRNERTGLGNIRLINDSARQTARSTDISECPYDASRDEYITFIVGGWKKDNDRGAWWVLIKEL